MTACLEAIYFIQNEVSKARSSRTISQEIIKCLSNKQDGGGKFTLIFIVTRNKIFFCSKLFSILEIIMVDCHTMYFCLWSCYGDK